MQKQWLLLITVSTGLLMITLDNSILYTALPTLITDLGASNEQGLWIINAYPMVMAGLLMGSGTLGDKIGHRRMFLIGLVLFGIASIVAAFSPTPQILIGARAFLAVGAAAMMPATLALIRMAFDDEKERNFAIAVWGSISVIGAALGPIVGGTLLEFFWWGSVFLINVPIVILALIATVLIAPPDVRDASRQWDFISSIQIMAGLVAAVYAIKEVSKTEIDWIVAAIAILVSIIGFVLFVRRQGALEQPLVAFSIFRNRAFSAGVAAAAFALFAVAGMQLVSTQRFQLVMDYSPLEAGLIVAAAALGSLPTALLAGAFLHRIGLLITITGGMVVGIVGVAIVWLAMDSAIGWTILGMVIMGAGLGSTMGVASAAIIGNAPKSRAGMASSIEEVSYEFGSLLAVAILGSLLTLIYTRVIVLPPGAPDVAASSLSDALQYAGSDPATMSAGFVAFETGYGVVMGAIMLTLVIGALITGWLLKTHGPGSSTSVVHH